MEAADAPVREVTMRDDSMIRVLGPIDVLSSSGLVAVGGRQVRALLGALVIGVGHAVPIDQLDEVLWGDERPVAADNTLQSYVSHLRQLLGPETIVLCDHSYRLDAGPDELDALRFEMLLGRAAESANDPTARLHCSREALRLWRGRPFGELADEEAFRLETYRLEELRLAAMEYSLVAELELGRHELIVGELESAVQEHPYHERLWCLLIESLARSGRRVEALREAARVRRVLAEVGVQVGPEIAALEQQILGGGGASTGV